ncbi:MAG: hypothetical protein HYY30_14535 [Chloroflexi bacterium]|nr:hypothetical protein [Chloroflexota bacterium]
MNNRVEAIVRRLFSDGEFREAAIKDASAALEQYELSEVERRSLSRLCRTFAPAGGASPSRGVDVLYWQ